MVLGLRRGFDDAVWIGRKLSIVYNSFRLIVLKQSWTTPLYVRVMLCESFGSKACSSESISTSR